MAGFGQGLIGFFGARIARVAFGSARHLDLLDVPYRGGAPALTDLLAGHVHVIFDNLPTSLEYIRAGKLRPLAVSTATRSDILPDLPTVSEFVPGYEVKSCAVPRQLICRGRSVKDRGQYLGRQVRV